MTGTLDPRKTALLLVDLQNDYILPDGALGRAGRAFDVTPIEAHLQRALTIARSSGALIVSLHYTVPLGRGETSLFRREMKTLLPSLANGDFAPGSPGHRLYERFQPSDISVEKVLPSGFVHSRLEWVLRLSGIETIVLAGIATNVGIAATFHDAMRLGFRTFVLGDCCASHDPAIHAATLISLGASGYGRTVVLDTASLDRLLDPTGRPALINDHKIVGLPTETKGGSS